MRTGAIVTGIVTLISLSGVMFAFVSSANPYVTIKEARSMKGDVVHVAGDIDRPTLKADALKNLVTFDMTDQSGERIQVRYDGPAPANMGEARQVVVMGTVEGSTLRAKKLLVKCPSKYEADKE